MIRSFPLIEIINSIIFNMDLGSPYCWTNSSGGGQNQSPSLEKKLGVQRRPQKTPYPQEESMQHLAVDDITGVNTNRGPI